MKDATELDVDLELLRQIIERYAQRMHDLRTGACPDTMRLARAL